MVNIYTISCKRTGYVYYVGATKYPLLKRLSGHFAEKKKSFLFDGSISPVIELVEAVDFKDAKHSEDYWISQFRAWGFNLCNSNISSGYSSDSMPSQHFSTSITLTEQGLFILEFLKKENRHSASTVVDILLLEAAKARGIELPKAKKG